MRKANQKNVTTQEARRIMDTPSTIVAVRYCYRLRERPRCELNMLYLRTPEDGVLFLRARNLGQVLINA